MTCATDTASPSRECRPWLRISGNTTSLKIRVRPPIVKLLILDELPFKIERHEANIALARQMHHVESNNSLDESSPRKKHVNLLLTFADAKSKTNLHFTHGSREELNSSYQQLEPGFGGGDESFEFQGTNN